MTLQEMGVSYFKTWKGKVLLAVTVVVAVVFVCFFANTLASNTYVPKEGESVVEKYSGDKGSIDDSINKIQRALAYKSLTPNLTEWISDESDLSKGIFCITTENYEYIVCSINADNIAETEKTLNDYNYIWVDSARDDFYAIINVSGKNVSLKDYYVLVRDETGIYASRAIFNFYEAETVDITDATVIGTILAPNAEVTYENATLYGQVQSKSVKGEIKYHKDIRFAGYKKVMDNLNVISLKNDAVRIAAIEYLINNNEDGRYSDYTASSNIRVRDINAVKKLNIHAPGVTYEELEADLASFPNLEEISISNGVLQSFSLEKLKGIKSLSITDTNIETLDISFAAELERLVLDNNKSLKTLDFTNNSKLKILSYSGTPLGWMDYSVLPELYYLDCSYSNVDAYLTITGETLQNVKMLDISGNGDIQTFYINTFPKLEKVNCSRCCIVNIDFTGMSNLQYFKGSYNRFTSIDFKGAENLKYIEVYGSTVVDIDVRGLKPERIFCTAQIIQDEIETEVDANGTEQQKETEAESNG